MRTEDSPRATLYESLSAAVFVASPYRRPIVGWMSDLDSMTADDVRAFYRRWYVPANAAVVIAGDVDVTQVRRLAEKYYGSIPARAVPTRKPRVEPEQAGVRRVDVKAPAEQAYVSLAFKVPGLGASGLAAASALPSDNEALALAVLAEVLDGYPGARLDRALTQGDARVADSAGASNGLWARGPQLFTLDGVPAKGKTAEQVEAALRAQVLRIAQDGISDVELDRVKTQWVAGEVYKLDSVFNQARSLGSYWALGLPLDAGDRLVERLRTVSADQVKAVAAKYFGDDQLTVATLRPQALDPTRKARTPPPGARH
jgi:zinc protease